MNVSTRQRLLAGTAARGLISARAEAAPAFGEIKNLIEEVNRTFEQFKAANDQRLALLEKRGASDPALDERLAKMDSSISETVRALDDANRRVAALTLGGGGGGGGDGAEHRQARDDFRSWMKSGQVQARTTTYSEPDGGYLAPPTLDTTISRILGQTVAMRRLSQVMSISTGSYIKHKSMGGAGAGWVGESDTGSARGETSTPRLVRMEFTVGEQYAEPYATQVSLDDMTINVEEWLGSEVSITFAEMEGSAFIIGDGVKKPRGLLSYPTVDNSSYAWGSIGFVKSGNASAFVAAGTTAGPGDCLIDLIHALKAGYRVGSSWLMNDMTLARVRKFRDAEGNYLWQPSLLVGQPSTLLGYAVDTDDNMPDVGADAFPIAFGDFRQAYLIVDRIGVRVLRNPFKVNGLVAFYTTRRVGGGVQNFEAVKLLKIAA